MRVVVGASEELQPHRICHPADPAPLIGNTQAVGAITAGERFKVYTEHQRKVRRRAAIDPTISIAAERFAA
jgi:hypothetical protein